MEVAHEIPNKSWYYLQYGTILGNTPIQQAFKFESTQALSMWMRLQFQITIDETKWKNPIKLRKCIQYLVGSGFGSLKVIWPDLSSLIGWNVDEGEGPPRFKVKLKYYNYKRQWQKKTSFKSRFKELFAGN